MSKKIIVTASILLLLVGGLAGVKIYSNENKKKNEPKITFKDNITFIKDQKSYSDLDENNEVIIDDLPIINPSDIIIESESEYDEISFNKVSSKDFPITLEFSFIDTSTVGENFTSTLHVRLKDNVKEFPFTYSVIENPAQ